MREKINLISILQAFTILWVVIGHASLDDIELPLPWYVEYTYSFSQFFCMPMFFIISGYLFRLTRKGWPYKKMIIDKIKRFCIPFVFFISIAFLLKGLLPNDVQRPVAFSFVEYLNSFLYPGLGVLAEMWFIAALMICFIFSPVWNILLSSRASSLLALFPLFILNCANLEITLFSIGEFLHYALFFYSGMLVCDTKLLENLNGVGVVYLSLIAFVIIILGYLLDFRFPIIIGVMILVYAFCYFLDRNYPKIFRSFRNYTYQIFLMAIFPQVLVKILYHHGLCSIYIVMFVICIIVGIYLPVFMSLIVKKLNIRFFKQIIGLK